MAPKGARLRAAQAFTGHQGCKKPCLQTGDRMQRFNIDVFFGQAACAL